MGHWVKIAQLASYLVPESTHTLFSSSGHLFLKNTEVKSRPTSKERLWELASASCFSIPASSYSGAGVRVQPAIPLSSVQPRLAAPGVDSGEFEGLSFALDVGGGLMRVVHSAVVCCLLL